MSLMIKSMALIIAPLMLSLLTGCDDDGEGQFKAAGDAALMAADPFLALTTFEKNAGDYGKYCSAFLNEQHRCHLRTQMEANIIMTSIEKGSDQALIYLFTTDQKSPKVYPYDVDEQKLKPLTGRLIELAEKAPADKSSQILLMSAADVLQAGRYVQQDSQKAISLYIKAWEAGSNKAASKLVDVYRYLKDYRHAYYWEIRSRDFTQDSRAELTHDEINEIQRVAADTLRSNL